jgi:endonuclease/exonuclease/phosphatase (EEP) superfamily protein YafD
MLIFLWIFILFITCIYFFRQSFIAELAISFVPYIIWFCVLAVFIEIFLILKESRRRRKNKTIRIFLIILATILTIWIGTLYSSEFYSFYNQPDDTIRLKDGEWIKIFYGNIYYKSIDYHSLQQKIEEENPDIVILVEFSDAHENEMKEFFKENYPYMNRNSWSTMLAWDVVFSKIPLENISYMKILCDECESWINLYVIHTSAPVSLKNFEMRNNQISKLLSDFSINHEDWDPTMIIWDFNLSPWSYYYKQFIKYSNMLNALSFQSPNYTRSLFQQKIFRSHIDQLFISPEIKISNVKIEDLTWSDHRSFLFKFWTEN